MKIEILDEAEADLIEGFHFFVKKPDSVGISSNRCFLILIPSFFTPEPITLFMGTIAASRNDFPFAVYYLVEGEIIRVYAVLDCRRNPAWTRKRLKTSG